MAEKGVKFSEEHRKKLSESHLGQVAWNKGKRGIYSEQSLQKMSENRKGKNKGRKHSEETKRKIGIKSASRKYGPMSEEHKQKISLALKGKPCPHPNRKSRKGIPTGYIPKSAFKKGHKVWNYIDGRSGRIDLKNRYGKDWPKIRESVFERDGYCCQCCKSDGIILEVHHIIPFMITKDNSMDNLISLCKKCHRKVEAEEMRKLKGREVA